MGKIELDHTGSGGGITLSSDGTDLLLDGTAIGGGGGSALELYAENPSSPTAPSATGNNAVAIGSNARASTSGSIAIGPSANILSGSGFNIAIGYNATMSDSYGAAIGYNSSATGNGSLAIGHTSRASGTYATAITRANASGQDSFAAAISTNSTSYGATGTQSIAMGYQCKATGPNTVSIGQSNTVSGNNATAIGYFNTASGYYTTALGYDNTTSGAFGHAIGYQAVSDVKGKGAYASGAFSADGDAQTGLFTLRSDTTDATAEAMTTDNSAAGTNDQIVVPSNAAFAFHGTIVAKQSGSANAAAWKVEGLIVNNGGTTTLTNSATTVISNTPSWGMALSADDTNDALKIQVTGAASTNIRWVATIHTSEVTYA